MAGVKMTELIEKMNLRYLTPDVDLENKELTIPDINRPALQLTGYFENYEASRIQIVGYVEYSYLQTLTMEERGERYSQLLTDQTPCLIYTTEILPDEEMLKQAIAHDIPIFATDKRTSTFQAELTRWLNVQLAPCMTIHGVLVDVYGVGVFIQGDSGIGKSEAALELIKRGHRLVADDAVEIRKVSDETLVGTAPSITKHMIELRGIGIVDVKTMFGVQSVRETQTIDMVITMEEWEKGKEYERIGLEDNYTELLGNKVVCYSIPIRPGRNVAIIVETAAINHKQKQMGYNAAQELYRRVQENLANKKK